MSTFDSVIGNEAYTIDWGSNSIWRCILCPRGFSYTHNKRVIHELKQVV
jgi:hypothetical protein